VSGVEVTNARVGIVAVATTLLASCGTGEDETTRTPLPKRVAPANAVSTLDRLAAGLADASRRAHCGAVAKLAHPAAALDATGCRRTRARVEGWSEPRVRRFGTGGVIEFVARGGVHRAAVASLATNGAYRLIFVADVRPRGSRGRPPEGTDEVADAIVDALVARDCNTLFNLAHRDIGIGRQPPAEACRAFRRLGFARSVRQALDARPIPEGGDGNFAFYAMRGSDGQRFTLVLGRPRLTGATAGPYRFVAVVEA